MKNFKLFHKKNKITCIAASTILAASICSVSIFGLHCRNISFYPLQHTYDSESDNKVSYSESDFQTYLNDLFRSEVTCNTLNLHFTLSNPSDFQISKYPLTFGNISYEHHIQELAGLENIKKKLQKYNPTDYPLDLHMTYDVLADSVNRRLAMSPYFYYEELLSSTNGVQSEYPILLAEYAFHKKQDIMDYFGLLEQFDSFFENVCEFEKQKAEHGLFMNETAAKNVIRQCSAFLPENSETSFWEATFEERLKSMEKLSEKEKKKYISKNRKLLKEHVYPAYRHLISVVQTLRHSGKNDKGLCWFQNGKPYYELLIKNLTGSSRSIPELEDLVSTRRDYCLSQLSRLSSLKAENNAILSSSAEDILDYLKNRTKDDFPKLPKTHYTVKTVNKKLEDFLSPAFYLSSTMDNFEENNIYINPAADYNGIGLFTTLAHEGYPGHLFQTVYSYSRKLPPLRYLLYHGGYTEGWATYVEMYSYSYSGLDEGLSHALMLNQDATLSLYATTDMGIHYDGWSLSDTVSFLSRYGITDISVISNMYETILENPGNYLKYYIGYLEFLNLKSKAKQKYGNYFSELAFHTTLLNMGSSPFYLLDKYFDEYYKAANIY